MIITAYNEVIPNVVVEGQRKVLEKFGEKIIQIKLNKFQFKTLKKIIYQKL